MTQPRAIGSNTFGFWTVLAVVGVVVFTAMVLVMVAVAEGVAWIVGKLVG